MWGTMDAFVSMKENRDFRRLYNRGKSFVSPVLVTYVMKNRVKKHRVGITTSKKVGCAVRRNRSRRVIREAFRLLAPRLPEGAGNDFVFEARARTPYVKMDEVYRVMEQHFKKAGVLAQNERPVRP